MRGIGEPLASGSAGRDEQGGETGRLKEPGGATRRLGEDEVAKRWGEDGEWEGETGWAFEL